MRSFSLIFAGTSACKVLSGVRLAWKVPCRAVARMGADARVGEVMADTTELGKDEVTVATVGAWNPVVLLLLTPWDRRDEIMLAVGGVGHMTGE